MFVIATISDTIRVPPPLLSQPTLTSVQTEIEKRYPNKIIVDVGLVIAPFGPPLQIGDGMFVPGDGGAHHQVVFKAIVFRPFVEEVLVGTVIDSSDDGVTVSIGGFFDHVFIPAYWMLNPSTFDENAGLWVWSPTYDDDDDADAVDEESEKEGKGQNGNAMADAANARKTVGMETEEGDDSEEEGRFEIEIGSEIRFKVKSVNFTRITTTMKGVQATTTTTAHASNRVFGLDGGSSKNGAKTPSNTDGNSDGEERHSSTQTAVRRRSSSADLSDSDIRPAPMQIVGSICEDGLGLTSWWKAAAEEEEEMEEN